MSLEPQFGHSDGSFWLYQTVPQLLQVYFGALAARGAMSCSGCRFDDAVDALAGVTRNAVESDATVAMTEGTDGVGFGLTEVVSLLW